MGADFQLLRYVCVDLVQVKHNEGSKIQTQIILFETLAYIKSTHKCNISLIRCKQLNNLDHISVCKPRQISNRLTKLKASVHTSSPTIYISQGCKLFQYFSIVRVHITLQSECLLMSPQTVM